jgi:phosphate transport system substrate-binding protein
MRILLAGVLLALVFPVNASAQDLSALPDYRPDQRVSGTLRSRGNDQMAPLMKQWERGFRKYQPAIQFADTLAGSASGMYGLEMRTADLAVMGRPIHPYERYGSYERSWVYPVEIEVATGSFEIPHKSPAYAILVHKDNPLVQLTIEQLDGIFGAQRGGGWQALTWDVNAARTSAHNIRTWGQLGLQGEWAARPIHVYGPPLLGAGSITLFQSKVLKGGDTWNEDLREYADRKQMIADLGKDRYGIAYTALGYRSSGVKPIAIAETSAGPFVELTRGSVADRTYPLSRPVYIVYTIDDEKSEIADPRVDPKVGEFLRYILSRQGQQDVVHDGAYLPLPLATVNEQLKKLASKKPPAELELLEQGR